MILSIKQIIYTDAKLEKLFVFDKIDFRVLTYRKIII